MLFQNLVLIAAILMLAVLLAYRPVLLPKKPANPNPKRLLALCEYLAAVIRLFIDLGDYAAQKKIDRRLRERAAISQIATNETKTQSDTMCEMARNGVSVKHDSADHHRSVESWARRILVTSVVS